MRALVAVIRIAMGLFVLIAVVATFIDTASRATINPFNFFGYFTLQTNIIAAVIFVIVGVLALIGREISYWLHVVRGMWVAYMALVGVIYNTLLVGTPGGGGVALEWANHVLHIVFPIYALLDWLLFADRPALKWKHLWLVIVDPVVWTGVVLIRGATDGWVPYPFLEPSNGYGTIALTVLGMTVTVLVLGALMWAISRLRIVKLTAAPAAPAAPAAT
ncbi:Pr6Pr family membrane protein [Agromyces sp. Soil535]|uniref:Pr6Pr family membrane protein n=1 Tax=Agromyces sp. Soil535 TaxID=1736390 RepID=UPI000A984626|nr:Pr6Pr family membrane protein [Agromyces sp. Soil535]